MQRFFIGMIGLFVVAMVPIWFWRNMSFLAYCIAVLFLIAVEFVGVAGMGAQRWIDLGFIRLQPSEIMKIGLSAESWPLITIGCHSTAPRGRYGFYRQSS